MSSTKRASAKTVSETIECTCCGKEKTAKVGFYNSSSILYKHKKKIPVCKTCIWDMYDTFFDEASEDEQLAVFRVCRLLDIVYLEKPFQSACEEAERTGSNVFKLYMKNINSLKQYSSYTFENGDSIQEEQKETDVIQEINTELTERDKQNESDVLRILGYDPFESENVQDRKYLFNRLVDMLDDSTLEDNVKLMSVIEIVKGFNQVDKVNELIAGLTSDLKSLTGNTGGMKSLVSTKSDLTKTILKIAEDNGISTKHNNSKSAGSGTLTGTMKKMSEIGLDEVEVNLFDIQTSQGMRQVADLSNKSIMMQLQLDESEYADMVAFQREEILKLRSSSEKFEEEARKLKIELAQMKQCK